MIEDIETNVGDQKLIELALYKAGIKSLRMTFKEISKKGLISDEGILIVQNRLIGLVYYRTGYSDH